MAAATSQAISVQERGKAAGFVAMVLVGGLGTRLREVVADRPKPLARVGDEPFLARVLDQLAAAGCVHAILCTGHLGEQIERECGRDHGGLSLSYSREASPLGTAGALRLALPPDAPAHVLVVNGDSFCDLDLRAFVGWARAEQLPAALVATTVADTMRFGRIDGAANGCVRTFTEKGIAGPGVINAGIYWLPTSAIAALSRNCHATFEADLLPPLIAAGLHMWREHAPFLDIGVPADYARAEAFFAACSARRARPRKGLLVLDRDGTLIEEKHYLQDPAQVQLLPGVVDGLLAFQAQGYEVAVVTNQSGIGRGYFDEAALLAVHAELQRQLLQHGITVRGIWHCPHTPADRCCCRKPEPALLALALQQLGYAPADCLVVGDKRCDIELGQRLGVRTALVRTGYGVGTERDGLCSPDWIVDTLAQLAHTEVRS